MATRVNNINDNLAKYGLNGEPGSPEFNAAWKRFREYNGVSGIVNLSLLKSIRRTDAIEMREILLDVMRTCQSICNNPAATTEQKVKAAETVNATVRAYDLAMETVVGERKMKPVKEAKKEEPVVAAPPEPPKEAPVPRFYEKVVIDTQNGAKTGTA